jgi:SAM-dependent methyltransferase
VKSIPAGDFAASLNRLIREVFEGPPSHDLAALLSPGGGLLQILDVISAEAASRAPIGGGGTIAAHTRHIRYYLKVLTTFVTGEPQSVDWEGSWSAQRVGDSEWGALRAELREDYAALLAFVKERDAWDPKSMGVCMAMLAHTNYHLGAIRQSQRSADLPSQFGSIDVYLFDQLLRGRITPDMRVLDAGCGGGRNSVYLMRNGADVCGVDADLGHVARVRALAAEHAARLPEDNFRYAHLTDIPFADDDFDAVLCNAVLHFARDEAEFRAMIDEMWRVLRPSGVFFVRLASSIGIEEQVTPTGDRWHRLPDGSDRFLVDEALLTELTAALDARLLDPLKTTVVQNLRSMTTWVLEKVGP